MKITPVNGAPRIVQLGSLELGDTFMFDSRIGMIACRNGQAFPLELATGYEFWTEESQRMLRPYDEVIPVNCEIRYEIKT